MILYTQSHNNDIIIVAMYSETAGMWSTVTLGGVGGGAECVTDGYHHSNNAFRD